MRVHQRYLAGRQPEGGGVKGGHAARQRGGEAGVDCVAAARGCRLLGVEHRVCTRAQDGRRVVP